DVQRQRVELFVAIATLGRRRRQFANWAKLIVLTEFVRALVHRRIAHEITDRALAHQARAVEIKSILHTNKIRNGGGIEWTSALTSAGTGSDCLHDGGQF